MSELYAGTAMVDITPPLGGHLCGYFTDRISENIHDPLYAKAIALRAGNVTTGIIVCDLIDIPVEVVAAAKSRIMEFTGVPATHILISATHTHTGPNVVAVLGTPKDEKYGMDTSLKIADAFVLALKCLQPARLAIASGDCSGEVHNRRWYMKDGTVRTNPGYDNKEKLRPAGPIDPQLLLTILQTPAGVPIAVLANLSLHYVGSPNGTWISADYFATFGEALQRCAGAKFMVIMSNGCQGDINNYDFTRPSRTSPHPYFQIERVANVVAAEAWKAWNTLREEDFNSNITLDAFLSMIPFKARTPTREEIDNAHRCFEEKETTSYTDQVYAGEILALTELPSEWDIPVQVMCIGSLGLVGLHGEMFCEIGLDIKARSPFQNTMVIGLANGSAGYIATDLAMDENSYEVRLARHVRAVKGTAGLWTDTAVNLLNKINKET